MWPQLWHTDIKNDGSTKNSEFGWLFWCPCLLFVSPNTSFYALYFDRMFSWDSNSWHHFIYNIYHPAKISDTVNSNHNQLGGTSRHLLALTLAHTQTRWNDIMLLPLMHDFLNSLSWYFHLSHKKMLEIIRFGRVLIEFRTNDRT